MQVFLSYHTPDEQVALSLKHAIERYDPSIKAYFAPYNLRLGAFWLPALSEAVEQCDAFLMLIGEHGLGAWQKLEYYEALDRRAKEPTFPLVPVLQGNQAPGLPFLRQLHWIVLQDLKPTAIAESVAGALGGKQSSDGDAKRRAWRTTNPYRGLLALKEDDAEFFFGREAETTGIVNAIAANSHKFVALVGNSGVGKTSLVQAGVIGALKRQRFLGPNAQSWPEVLKDSRRWGFLTMKPGDDPIRALAGAFTSQWFDKPTDAQMFEQTDAWSERLSAKGRISDLIDATEGHFSSIGVTSPSRYFLYVDQGEELYARAPRSKQARFSEIVAAGLSDPRIVIMTSLRSDYYGQLQADELIFSSSERIDIPPLSGDALVAVLTEPARVLGASFDNDDLVTTLVRGARHEPGALPLLADFMTELWREMQYKGDGVLRLATHTELIHVGASLAKRADEFLAQNPNQREIVKRLFSLKLSLVQQEGEPVRRRVEKSACTDEEWGLVEKLTAPEWRLLVTGQEHGAPVAEVAHEVLLRQWPTLRTWLADQRDFLVWLGQVERARKQHEAATKIDKLDTLLLGRALTEAEQWLQTRPKDIGAAETAFITRSIARRNAQRGRARIGVLTAAAVLTVFACFSGYQWLTAANALVAADKERIAAEQAGLRATRERDAARRSQSTYLAEFARGSHQEGDLLRSTLLAVEALPDEKRGQSRPLVRAAEDLIATNYYQMATQRSLVTHATLISALRLVPGRRQALTASHDGTARLWDLDTLQPVLQMAGHLGPIVAADVSKDGKLIATASYDTTARIWDARTGRLLQTLVGHGGRVLDIALGANGRIAATGSADGTARIWDIDPATTLIEIGDHPHGVKSVALSLDGKLLLTVSGVKDGTGRLLRRLDQDRGKARIWDVASGRMLHEIQAGSNSISSALFTPDGTYVVGVDELDNIVVFSVLSGSRVAQIEYEKVRGKFTISADSTLMAIARYNEPTAIYEIATGRKVAEIEKHEQTVKDLVFMPDSAQLITTSNDDNKLRLWNAHTGAQVAETDTGVEVRKIDVTHDGRSIVFESGNDLYVQDVSSGTLKSTLQKGRSTSPDSRPSMVFGSGSKHMLWVTDKGPTLAWDLQTFKQIGVLQSSGSLRKGVSFSPDSSLAAVASIDQKVNVWRLDTVERVAGLALPVDGILFSPDGSNLAISTVRSGGEITDLGRSSRAIDTSGAQLGRFNTVISPDGRRLYTIDTSDTPIGRLWDLDTGRLIATIRAPAGSAGKGAFNPQSTRLITISDEDKIVRQYDAETGRELAILAQGVSSAHIFGTGRGIVGMTSRNEFRSIDTTTGAVLMTSSVGTKDDFVALTVSDDGRRLLAKYGKQIDVVDGATGHKLATIRDRMLADLGYPQLTEDLKRTLVRSNNGLVIFETDTGQQQTRLDQTWQHEVAFRANRDGSRIIADAYREDVEIFDGASGAKIAVLGNSKCTALFVADGTRVLVSHSDGRLHLLDATSAQQIVVLRGPKSGDREPWAVSKDKRLIAIITDDLALSVFDAMTGSRIATLAADGRVDDLEFSPSGSHVAARFETAGYLVFDAKTGAVVGRFTGPAGTAIAFSATGQRIVTYFAEPEVALYDTVSWVRKRGIGGHRDEIRSMAFSPDGKRIIVTGGLAFVSSESKAIISDTTDGSTLAVLIGHKGRVKAANFSPDGKRVVTASTDGTARIWDADTGKQIKVLEHRAELSDARFDVGGRTITTTVSSFLRDTEIRRWSADTFDPILDPAAGAVVASSPDGRQTAIFSKNEMRVVDTLTAEPQLTIHLMSGRQSFSSNRDEIHYAEDPFDKVVVSPDGRTAASTLTGAVWRMLWTTQDYVDYSKEAVPRCLTPEERKTLYLDPEPPAWCIEMNKWPYQSPAWKAWLADVTAGKQVNMPDAK